MKKYLLIFLSIGLAVMAAYWFYFRSASYTQLYDVMPQDALAVLHTRHLVGTWNELQSAELWKVLEGHTDFAKLGSALLKLDSLSGSNGSLDKWFRTHPVSIALYQEGRDKFAFLFLTQMKEPSFAKTFQRILEAYQEQGFRLSQRQYRGRTIQEVRGIKGEVLSYYVEDDVLSLSFSPFLIEESIRTIEDASLRANYNFNWENTRKESLQFWVDFSRIAQLERIFFQTQREYYPSSGAWQGTLSWNGKQLMAQGEIKGTEAEHWSNFLVSTDNASYSLNPDFIPFAAQSLQGMLSTKAELSRNFQVVLNKEFPRRESLVKSFTDKTNFSPDFLQEQLQGEFLHVRFQSNQLQNNNQVILLPLSDAQKVRLAIEKMQDALRMHDSGTGMGTMESYDGLNFQNIPLEEWPYLWLGPGFQGFSRVFVADMDGILILGNSRAAIQTTKDNWSELQRNASNQSISLANRIYPLYYQRIMQQELRPSWLNEWKSKRPFWEKLQHIEWQLRASNSGTKNLKLDIFFDQQSNNTQELGMALLNNVDLGTSLSRHLKVHARTAEFKEVLVFTANHQLVSISDNSLNWSYDAFYRPMNDVAILDYFGDGSIYYLWIDEQARVHLLESSGNPVPGFPQELKGTQTPLRMAQQLKLAGKDDFHFLVQDAAGSLHQFDRFFNVLPSLGPQRMTGNILYGSQSQVYRGERLFSYHTSNGLIYLSRTDGSLLPGFPVDVKKRMNSALIWTAAADEANARMLSISEDGEVVRVGVDGQIKGRDQLYRPSRESKFYMAVDEQSGGYIFIRLNYNEMTVFSSSMQELFTAALVPGESYSFQFFMASPIASYLILSDPVQEFAYVYDMQGNLVGGQPIASGGKVQWMVNPDGQSFRIFSTYGQNLLTFGFKP